MLRRYGALGPNAEPHSPEIGAASIAVGLRAIHRRSSPQRYGSPIYSVAGADWRIASWVDSSRATHGGEYREAAVARGNCQVHGPVAPPNRALVQAGFELRAEALFPRNALTPRTVIVSANGNADHGYHHSLRISVAAAFLEVLPQSIWVPTERRAQPGRPKASFNGPSQGSKLRHRSHLETAGRSAVLIGNTQRDQYGLVNRVPAAFYTREPRVLPRT